MTEATGKTDAPDERDAQGCARKPYAPPQLTLFGHVAALTKGSACSATNDGSGSCVVAGGAMGMTSDRRLKHDIVKVGDHPMGFGLYLFRYLEGDGSRRFGVMADEVAAIQPGAVQARSDGYLTVRYDLLGIRPALH